MSTNDILDDPELADLERRLRDTCRATIPLLLADQSLSAPGPADGPSADVVPIGPPSPPRRWSVAAAVVVLAVGAVGLIAQRLTSNTDGTNDPTGPVASAPVATTTPTDPTETVAPGAAPVVSTTIVPGFGVCDDEGCSYLDPLAVTPGVTDFYVGAEELGEPQVHLELFEQLVRCAELTPDGTACARIEGIAGVGLADYPDSASDGSIEIGTTFATIAPEQYARQWGPTQGGGQTTPVTVRGHDGIRYMNEDRPALVWVERPNTLVWVAVSPELDDQLSALAETVRLVEGPSTVPHRVVVPELGTPWDASANDGDGVLVAVHDGEECVGYGFVDHCGTAVSDRIAVRTRADGGMLVVGSTPADIPTVNVTYADGSAPADTIEFAPYSSRFYAVGTAPNTRPLTVEWVEASGDIVDSGPITAPFGLIPSDGGSLALIDASGTPDKAQALANALGDRGIVVSLTAVSPITFEQTMLMPIGEASAWSYDLASLIGVGGFDSWTLSLLNEPLPATIADVIVLGTDGGPDLPLPLPSGMG